MMKTKLSVLLLSLVVCLCAFTTSAQGEEQEEASLFFTIVHRIKPHMIVQYEESGKIIMKQFEKQNFPFTFFTWEDGSFSYYYFYPMKSFADIDKLWIAWGDFVENWGAEGAKTLDLINASMESYEDFMLRHLIELTFIPENPRLKDDEEVYAAWDMHYLLPGKETEYLQLMKKFLALFKKINLKDRIYIHAGEMGMDKPVYIAAGGAKDPTDYWSQNKKMWEAMGQESTPLMLEFFKLIRKREFKQFWYRPDFSHIPSEK
jgi:hypothetical protein